MECLICIVKTNIPLVCLQIPPSETPSPPPGLTKPNPVVPISSSNHNARSPFEGAAAESQSLFSDNSNFRHPNPLPNSLLYPTSSPSTHDWPTAPEPQSLFTSGMYLFGSIPVDVGGHTWYFITWGTLCRSNAQIYELGVKRWSTVKACMWLGTT